MKTYDVVIVSDLHIGTEDFKVEKFLEFIDSIQTDLLILNGDIIDGWAFERGAKWKKKHTKVIAKLLKMSNKTDTIWIRGNHDEFIRELIGHKIGSIQIEEDYILTLSNGQKYYIFHGDVVDVFITKYKWLAKIGSVGYDFALWLNSIYNTYRNWRGLPYYSISKRIKESVKAATNHINSFEETAVSMAMKKGCVGVICGHIHSPSDKRINGGHYLNSGDWVENMTAICIDSKCEITIVNY